MSRTCDICHKTYSCRQNLWRHKKNVHEKSNHKGSGLWTQTVNEQMKRGYGLVKTADADADTEKVRETYDKLGNLTEPLKPC